jgi:hypothetical protein
VPGEDSNPWQSPNLSTSLNNLDNPEKVLKGIYLLGKDLEILSCFFFLFCVCDFQTHKMLWFSISKTEACACTKSLGVPG